MSPRKLVIAIDGPAASGKSTTAKLAAEKLGYVHVDTGAMYRAVTLKILRQGIDAADAKRISALLAATHVELRNSDGTLQVFLDGENVTGEIRSLQVTRAVSAISALRPVRDAMIREQRLMGKNGGMVLEGRDIGTVVFPDADLKFFMIAGIEARAWRRQKELQLKGIAVDLDTLIKEIDGRDRNDASRTESPLRKASDAIEVDTTDMTIEQQVDVVVGRAKEMMERRRE